MKSHFLSVVIFVLCGILHKTAIFVSLDESNLATFQRNDQEWIEKVGVSLIERWK